MFLSDFKNSETKSQNQNNSKDYDDEPNLTKTINNDQTNSNSNNHLNLLKNTTTPSPLPSTTPSIAPSLTKATTNTNNLNRNPKIKILKSYYNKDASASVTRSFLSIDETHQSHYNTNNIDFQSKTINNQLIINNSDSLSSLSSLSLASTSSHNKNKNNNQTAFDSTSSATTRTSISTNSKSTSQKTKPKLTKTRSSPTRTNSLSYTSQINHDSIVGTSAIDNTNSSCTTFVNQLVDDKIKKLDQTFVINNNNNNTNLITNEPNSSKTLPLNKKKTKSSIIKRFSIKSNKNTSSDQIENLDSQITNTAATIEQNEPNTNERKNSKDLIQIGVKLISKILIATNANSNNINNNNNNNNTNPNPIINNNSNNINSNNSNTSLNNSIDTKSKSSLSSLSNINLSQSQSFPTNLLEQNTSNKNSLLNKSLDDLDSNNSTQNKKQKYNSNTNEQMYQYSLNANNNQNNNKNNQQYNNFNKQCYLLNKKFRKWLPFNYGLKNHGNTCFMNCVLQCLFHTSPLTDFFVTNQYEHDIQSINLQRQQHLLNLKQDYNNKLPPFILTRLFHKLLLSMWQNTYDSNYSSELKQLIGYLNPTFAGANQNDSHEFCVWLLDRLSQELTYSMIRLNRNEEQIDDEDNQSTNEDEDESGRRKYVNEKQKQKQQITSSFIEELFKVKFKSTVKCSNCNYESSKYETDMMLSLPLPQNNQSSKTKNTNINQSQNSQKQYLRRTLYLNLILTNQSSLKQFTSSASGSSSSSSPSSTSSFNSNTNDSYMSKSRFYLSEISTEPSANDIVYNNSSPPFNVKIGVNVHITSDNIYSRELVNLNENSTSTANANVINPDLSDLRQYIETWYRFKPSNLVFIDVYNLKSILYDNFSLKELYIKSNTSEEIITKSNSSFCVLELNQINNKDQMPLINIIAANVYYESTSSSSLTQLSNYLGRRPICFGLPFVVLINRDCTYSELCKKLLEAQSKYFKDKNILKYKDLAEKFFTLSLVVGFSKQTIRINSSDELPLYAECIDKALNESTQLSQSISIIEHIRINIEWRSCEDISSFINDFTRPDITDNTAKRLQKIDETEEINKSSASFNGTATSVSTSSFSNSTSSYKSTASNITTLNDCFELFTQCEELTDDNSWTCTKCKKQTNANKKLSISSVPPVLIIHLKRFFYKSKTSNFKLTTPVWFPVSNLDMSKYITHRQTKFQDQNENDYSYDLNDNYNDSNSDRSSSYNRNYIYDLFAVCNHKGQNMANGHYTAYCKNLIDTKWYCFDDSNCTPLNDTSVPNTIFNNGSLNIFTENAYILFYKRRNCMRNEKWWINYIDRSLLDYNDFEYYLRNLDYIERQQQDNQHQEQLKFLKQQQPVYKTTANLNGYATMGKKGNGIKTIRDKILGNGSRSHSEMSNSAALNNYDMDHINMTSIDDEIICQRELNRQAERQRQQQEEYLKGENSRGNLIELECQQPNIQNNYSCELINSLNVYDEHNKPKRLLKQDNGKELSFSLVNTPLTSSPAKPNSNSPSTPSSSSKGCSNNTLSNLATSSPSSQPSINLSQSSSIVNVKLNTETNNLINFNDTNLSNDLNQKLNVKEDVDFLLNYPNDNEFIYKEQTPSSNVSNKYYKTNNPNYYNQYSQYPTSFQPNLYYPKQLVFQPQIARTQTHMSGMPNSIYQNQISYQQRGGQPNNKNAQIQQANGNICFKAQTNSNNASNNNTANSTSRYINPTSIETHI